MIDRDERLPVTSQCELLDVARSTVYYQPKPTPAGDIDLMRRIDEIHLTHPFLGSRRIVDALAEAGFVVNRKKVVRLMRMMGLAALYPKRRTTIPAVGHRIYPYLLRGLKIDRPNQVWCADVTYLPDLAPVCWTRSIPGLSWGKRDDPSRWQGRITPMSSSVTRSRCTGTPKAPRSPRSPANSGSMKPR